MTNFTRKISALVLACDMLAGVPIAYAGVRSEPLATEWFGIAASPNKRVVEVANRTEELEARSEAKYECEQASGRTCTAIAVPTSWNVVVVRCTQAGKAPASIVGGSGKGIAMEVAFTKASAAGFRPTDCVPVYSH
jgi:hypothetical protein